MKRIIWTLLFVLAPATAYGEKRPSPKVANARGMFSAVLDQVRAEYVDDAKTDTDALYSEAIHGLLSQLGETNQLLTPEDLAWMKGSVKGSISGIGVVFEKVGDLVIVKEVLPGAPASNTRMASRDRILAVDGASTAEMSMKDIAQKIRGTAGTSVELLMQRGADEWTETITRGPVKVDFVLSHVRDDGVAYVRITSFTENVTKSLDAALANFPKGGPGLLLDLRGCRGGLFNKSLEVADRFLPRGRRIVSVRGRDKKEVVHRASTPAAYAGRIVVLVDEETASSAEIVAAALAENDLAVTVGEKTYGKGTIEKILELPDGYGLKLTIARFYSPKGNHWQGRGIVPNFVIPSDHRPDPTYTKKPEHDLEQDVQLKAALGVLSLQR